MKAEIVKIAAKYAQLAYSAHNSVGTTDFAFTDLGSLQVLAFAGTNEALDWIDNIRLASWRGVKLSAYRAAKNVGALVNINRDAPLLVTGHSKGGAEAIAYSRLFRADFCVAFCPARCLRYWENRTMENTAIFIDPDDPVPKLGFMSFGHPKCETIRLPNDAIGLSIGDHFMDGIIKFLGIKE